jgi:hypothetical protein
MAETLGSMKARVVRWARETIDDDLAADAVNDAIESLWLALVQVNLSSFVGGPVQNVSFAAASERATVVSITDPTATLTVGMVAGGNIASRTWICGYTYVTESGSETKPSPTTQATIPANNLARITPPPFVAGAIGWNLYVGDSQLDMGLQNDSPIDFAHQPDQVGAFYTEPDGGFQVQPDSQSPPTTNNTADDIFYVKVLEVQNPDTTWTRWQGAALEDLLMSRAEKSIATQSTYTPYCYDLVNGSTFEIRPAAGQTLNPRYFYTKKPRRLRFDKSLLPFSQYAGSVECIGDRALGKVQAALKEYEGAQYWEENAARREMQIMQALNLQNRQRVQTITPFRVG